MEFDSEASLQAYMQGSGHSFCELTLSQGTKPLGVIVLELFTDVCPATSKNFVRLVQGPGEGREGVKHSYKGSPIHRVVANAYIQVHDGCMGGSHAKRGTFSKHGPCSQAIWTALYLPHAFHVTFVQN